MWFIFAAGDEYLPAILPHKAKVAHHNPKPTLEDKASIGDQEHNWQIHGESHGANSQYNG